MEYEDMSHGFVIRISCENLITSSQKLREAKDEEFPEMTFQREILVKDAEISLKMNFRTMVPPTPTANARQTRDTQTGLFSVLVAYNAEITEKGKQNNRNFKGKVFTVDLKLYTLGKTYQTNRK